MTRQSWQSWIPGAAVTAAKRESTAEANAASSSPAEEQDPQKHIEGLTNTWIDRTLTPAIQKQVCSQHHGLFVFTDELISPSCMLYL